MSKYIIDKLTNKVVEKINNADKLDVKNFMTEYGYVEFSNKPVNIKYPSPGDLKWGLIEIDTTKVNK